MPTWFLLSLLSAVFAGFFVFMQKIAAMRNYNTNTLNTYGAAGAAVIGLTIAGILEDFSNISWLMIAISALAGSLFIISSNFRMDSLRYIDSTIFFPLHKFLSPLFAMVIGVLFLKESLTMPEWLGVILGLITPLLLITKSEHHRQNHLKKGLLLMLLSALMAALAAAVNKYGADLFSSILILAALIYVFSALFGMLLTLIHGNNSKHGKHSTNAPVVFCFVMGALGYLSFATIMIAFSLGGLLSVVYTINSMYILVPIVLSIIYYKEHWNLQKVLAIAASLLALFFMV